MTSAPPAPYIPPGHPAAAVTLPRAEGSATDPTPPASAPVPPPAAPAPLLRSGDNAQRLAFGLYLVAAAASWIGQIWVGVDQVPWPYFIPIWAQIIIVALPAAVLDLGGVATMAIADWRRSEGETAWYWRTLSAIWVTLAVGVNVLGHRHQLLLSVLFGIFGVLAFAMALGHTEARRRDALKAKGLLPRPKPRYDDDVRKKEPDVVRLAEHLVVEEGYDQWPALDLARERVKTVAHRDALAAYLKSELTRMHAGDGALAGIVVGATRFDLLADQVMAQFDLGGWAAYIGTQMRPPADSDSPEHTGDDDADLSALLASAPGDLLRRIPSQAEDYDQWRWLWAKMKTDPAVKVEDFAREHNLSPRQAYWIRKVGGLRLLDSHLPPVARLLHVAKSATDPDWAALAGQPRPTLGAVTAPPPAPAGRPSGQADARQAVRAA
ncbi:hypothetical protein [Catellatospora chokoriensis]|uniref:DUF2637 domain-containing protein n=1 Tax=Catellatospora chokoriensis TaxID=310353 RepID=A0A8J3KC30_9ACTN|nr:hypothetical protein [Catellatospora chokoriensis]GIF94023.1 hypothetical protein Cch02nite_74670 [Catellatospora chokoriensis]